MPSPFKQSANAPAKGYDVPSSISKLLSKRSKTVCAKITISARLTAKSLLTPFLILNPCINTPELTIHTATKRIRSVIIYGVFSSKSDGKYELSLNPVKRPKIRVNTPVILSESETEKSDSSSLFENVDCSFALSYSFFTTVSLSCFFASSISSGAKILNLFTFSFHLSFNCCSASSSSILAICFVSSSNPSSTI